jgi:hypothetical protein
MNSLSAPQELHAGDQLVSNNGIFVLQMNNDGSLSVYRKQLRWSMWASPALNQPGGFAVMQHDGNFVCYSSAGVPYWASNTDGHPGAWLALLDDGNLVVLAPGRVLWQTRTVIDVDKPAIRYTGEGGYSYDETAEKWKAMCAAFPCFTALQWPGYATAVIDDVIDGVPVVIQLWKGLCEKFEGGFFADLPGGVGAEVGIYRRIPGKVVPTSFPGLPPNGLLPKLAGLAGAAAATELWWPFPELGATIEFRFVNPITREVVFSAGPQTTYWLTKWMEPSSYTQYTRDHTAPGSYTSYILEYTINGKHYHHWPAEPGDLGGVAEAAWLPLLLAEDPPAPPPHPPRRITRPVRPRPRGRPHR